MYYYYFITNIWIKIKHYCLTLNFFFLLFIFIFINDDNTNDFIEITRGIGKLFECDSRVNDEGIFLIE